MFIGMKRWTVAMLVTLVSATVGLAGDGGMPNPDELSDDDILLPLVASRDYCKKADPGQSALYEKGFAFLTADSPNEVQAFFAKPGTAEAVAKRVAEFEARDKVPDTAGFNKSMCEDYIKMQ